MATVNSRNESQNCSICQVLLVPFPGGHAGPLHDNHATRNDVPPNGQFCDPKPSDLITVPCCYKHNRIHSGVAEGLTMLAALEIGRNEGGETIPLCRLPGGRFPL